MLKFHNRRITNLFVTSHFLREYVMSYFFSLATQLTLTIGGTIQKDDPVFHTALQHFFFPHRSRQFAFFSLVSSFSRIFLYVLSNFREAYQEYGRKAGPFEILLTCDNLRAGGISYHSSTAP